MEVLGDGGEGAVRGGLLEEVTFETCKELRIPF